MKPPARGFSLLEVIVVLAIFSILAGAMAPLLIRSFEVDRETETITEMRAILDGLFGRPDLNIPGYISDVGALPCTPTVVVTGLNPACPLQPAVATPFISGRIGSSGMATATVHTTGMPLGFSPPYVISTYPNPGLDAWGRSYRIMQVGAVNQIAIVSDGQNGQYEGGSGDDIVLPGQGSAARLWQGGISLTVQMVTGGGSRTLGPTDLTTVDLYYPTPTGPVSIALTPTSGASDYRTTGASTSNIPFGIRGVHVKTITNYPLCLGNPGNVCETWTTVMHYRQWTTANVYLRPATADARVGSSSGIVTAGNVVSAPTGFVQTDCSVVASPALVSPPSTQPAAALNGVTASATWISSTQFRLNGNSTYNGTTSLPPQVSYLVTCQH